MNDMINDRPEPKRNPDGTLMKGYTANPGGMLNLSKGQKIVREESIRMLPKVMKKMEEWINDDCIPIEIRFKIAVVYMNRGAGKVQEAPTRDSDDSTKPSQMTGPELIETLEYLRQNMLRERAREGEE